jgi:cyclophilin family peptidyl-prolyl cis-trans isomerase
MTLIISCSKKEEQPMQQDKSQDGGVPQFETLTDDQIATLLSSAKAAHGEEENPTAVLSENEITAILDKVAETEVEQVAADEIALLETTKGTMAVAFYTGIAPEHTKSFKRLVTSGYYNGTRFHRIIDNFMIQGGDILTRDDNPDNDGTGGPGYNLPAEFNGIPHDLGILSMARSQNPNSAGSQFFLCLSRQGTAGLDGQYTVFGKVIGGLDVLKTLGKVAVRPSKYGENSVPVEPEYILNAYMVTR